MLLTLILALHKIFIDSSDVGAYSQCFVFKYLTLNNSISVIYLYGKVKRKWNVNYFVSISTCQTCKQVIFYVSDQTKAK